MKNSEKLYTESVVQKYFERESIFDDFNFCQNLKHVTDKLDFKKDEDPGGTGNYPREENKIEKAIIPK
jgi:hypothetical protein